MPELYRILKFNRNCGNCGGSLVQFQPGPDEVNALPFPIAKVLYTSDVRPGDVRGRHAHYRTQEIAVCLEGACTFDLEDGRGRTASVRLTTTEARDPEAKPVPPESPRDTQPALLLYPFVWRTLRDFEPGTRLLVIADTPYDEADYIRDYKRFLEVAAKR
jgi:hypothetical protein